MQLSKKLIEKYYLSKWDKFPKRKYKRNNAFINMYSFCEDNGDGTYINTGGSTLDKLFITLFWNFSDKQDCLLLDKNLWCAMLSLNELEFDKYISEFADGNYFHLKTINYNGSDYTFLFYFGSFNKLDMDNIDYILTKKVQKLLGET